MPVAQYSDVAAKSWWLCIIIYRNIHNILRLEHLEVLILFNYNYLCLEYTFFDAA